WRPPPPGRATPRDRNLWLGQVRIRVSERPPFSARTLETRRPAMSVTIKINGLTLSHKGSNGFVRNTLPDVCKTPSPGGPVPVPYPVIISRSSDLENGTTTVTADGGNMVSIKGSEYSRCNGDEAGTAGGVKSSTNMKEAKWILYSFDVKFDGSNVC